LHNASGSGFTSETLIAPSNAANLKPKAGWPVKLTNGSVCPSTNDQCSSLIASEPAVATVAGMTLVYVGSWNGDEYALCATSCTVGSNTYTSGQIVWSTYLGRTSGCGTRPVVYVGGGGDITLSGSVMLGATSQLFALDALTGAVIWQTALGSAPSHYVWSSPVFANNSIYLGTASQQDCPLVQGQVLEIDPTSGQVMNLFGAVADGCRGASVWGSAAVDPAGNVYVATGNGVGCKTEETYSEAVIKLTSTLGLVSSWQVPSTEQTPDGDFGSTPTLFTGTVTTGGPSRSLVGVANKNGTYYVFDQDDISAGPVERLHIAVGGGSPTGGQGSISPSSWDGRLVYVAGGGTTIDGKSYNGSVRAYNPNNLSSPVWQHGFSSGPVVAAVSTNPGLAMIGSWNALTVVDSATGAMAFTANATTQSHVFGGRPSLME
jgi:hypothetical protein